jgi:CheY-like chemotaxis protein
MLVDVVTSRGHQALPAGSAEEGMTLLPIWTFQVAFLDQGLPGMEGLVLGEFLRKNNPDMTIALVTGEDAPRVERQARDLSITYIAKPFDVRQIEEVLDEAVSEAHVRSVRRRSQADPDFAPPIARHAEDIGPAFEMPHLPDRISDRLVTTLKRKLSDLRSVGRYTERDRVLALSGLLTARVLGIDLPKTSAGLTLYEEYDQIMLQQGRRTEFDDG